MVSLSTPSPETGRKEFAIIGGGSTGPTLLFYIAQKIKEHNLDVRRMKFHLVDPNGFGSGGIAYGHASKNHYLNSTRDEMSPWNSLEFHHWSCDQKLGDSVQSFNLRSDNVKFIKQKVTDTINFLRARGVNVIEHKCEGYPVKEDDGTFGIQNQNGETFIKGLPTEDFVITTGYGPNENLESLHQYTGDGYVHDIYDPNQLSPLLTKKGQKRISFAGTGPALYDFANDLPQDSNGELLLSTFSRAGTLLQTRDVNREPNEQSVPPNYLEGISPESVEDLKQLIQADFTNAAHSGERTDRRIALDIMRDLGKHLQTMDVNIARAFRCSSFLSTLKGKATPVPNFSQQQLLKFKPNHYEGYLNGNITRMKDGTFQIKTDHQGTIEADFIINGTGHGRCNSKTARHCIENGWAEIDPHLGILATDETDYRLTKSGIQMVGPSVHFGIDGVESFAIPAEKIANAFAARLTAIAANAPFVNRSMTG